MNPNDFLTIKKTPEYSLTDAERAYMRAQILMRPAHTATHVRVLWQSYVSVFAVLLLVCISSGGVGAYAARHAIPGDTLYGVKRTLTEPLLSLVVIGKENEAQFRIALGEERLREAQVLAVTGSLSEERATYAVDSAEKEFTHAVSLSPIASKQAQTVRVAHRTLLSAEAASLPEEHARAIEDIIERIDTYVPSVAEENVTEARASAYERVEQLLTVIEDGVWTRETEETAETLARSLSTALTDVDAFSEDDTFSVETYVRIAEEATRTIATLRFADVVKRKTDQEVVMTFTEEAPTARSAKVATEESLDTVSMSLMAVPTDDIPTSPVALPELTIQFRPQEP